MKMEELPIWKTDGEAPPESKRKEGWKVGDRPPGKWLDWLYYRTYRNLEDLQESARKMESPMTGLDDDYVWGIEDELNRLLVDILVKKEVEASYNDSFSENIDKVADVKAAKYKVGDVLGMDQIEYLPSLGVYKIIS